MGALSATWNKKYRGPFEPLVPDFQHVPFNNLEKLEAIITDQTAAVLLEVVQGEGGVHPAEVEFLAGAEKLCRERGALLIIDEIQTGFGRTGKMFAFEHYGISPDMVTVAKSLGGGIPIGAVLIGERIVALSPGLHGSTFGGNPLSAAAAAAALEALIEEDLPQKAAELGAYLVGKLKDLNLPVVSEIRGMGLMIGIETRQKVAPYLRLLSDNGVLALSAGLTVIRLLPPLTITRAQVDQVIAVLEKVLNTELETA